MGEGASVPVRKRVPEIAAAPSVVPLSLSGSRLHTWEVPGHREGHFRLGEGTAVHPKLAAKPCGASRTLAEFLLAFCLCLSGAGAVLSWASTHRARLDWEQLQRRREAPSWTFQQLCDTRYIMMHTSLSGPLLKRQMLSILGCPVLQPLATQLCKQNCIKI